MAACFAKMHDRCWKKSENLLQPAHCKVRGTDPFKYISAHRDGIEDLVSSNHERFTNV